MEIMDLKGRFFLVRMKPKMHNLHGRKVHNNLGSSLCKYLDAHLLKQNPCAACKARVKRRRAGKRNS